MKFLILPFLLLFCIGCKPGPETKEEDRSDQETFFNWVSKLNDPILDITFSWDSLMHHREEEGLIDAEVVISDEEVQELKAQISTRGQHRKKHCDFPPLKLVLDKDFVKQQGWAKGRKYKLVTDCTEEEDDFLYREKLVYDLQKIHSPYFLETILVPVRYHLRGTVIEGHVILIEREEDMADRLDFDLQDPTKNPIKLIHQEVYEKLVLFQYMIGNTDWNLTRGHNILWLTKEDGSTSPISVPYDFDQCGLVNASYAQPYPSLPIKHVRERFLQYRGKDKLALQQHLDFFTARREQTLQVVAESPHLTDGSKADISRYLDAFYLQLEDMLSGLGASTL
ncbi:MAG: hypothetical protein KTR24_06390 [Saprospiraceae bacterium]|nr:hypothetical protein [Saprospiraceae bacterium]